MYDNNDIDDLIESYYSVDKLEDNRSEGIYKVISERDDGACRFETKFTTRKAAEDYLIQANECGLFNNYIVQEE